MSYLAEHVGEGVWQEEGGGVGAAAAQHHA